LGKCTGDGVGECTGVGVGECTGEGVGECIVWCTKNWQNKILSFFTVRVHFFTLKQISHHKKRPRGSTTRMSRKVRGENRHRALILLFEKFEKNGIFEPKNALKNIVFTHR
jgi:hypothetical protein